MATFIDYDRATIIQKLRQLDPDAKPNWGLMTPQHMVEHLIVIFKIANGSIPSELYIDEEKIPRQQAFLRSDKEFPKHIRIKNLHEDKPLPLRMESMEAAIEKLDKEIVKFEEVFEAEPDQKTVHPIFGALDYDDWVTFHRKHTTHHFKQFGLFT